MINKNGFIINMYAFVMKMNVQIDICKLKNFKNSCFKINVLTKIY